MAFASTLPASSGSLRSLQLVHMGLGLSQGICELPCRTETSCLLRLGN